MGKSSGWLLLIPSVAACVIGTVLALVAMASTGIGGDPDMIRRGWALFLGGAALVLTGIVLYLAWFAIQNKRMNELTGGRFNTVLWTILLIVPIVNIASLYFFSDHIRQAHMTANVAGMHHVAVFLLLWFVPILGAPLAQVQVDKLQVASSA